MTVEVEGELGRRQDSEADGPVVEVSGITKVFPRVVANDRISLSIRPGEVHCLLGENGAGKSTLMSILSGIYQPDEGTIKIGGREARISSPKDALELGIGTVYQHPTLIPVFSVVENLMLGDGDGIRLNEKQTLAQLQSYSDRLGLEVDPYVLAGRLSLGQQQQIEIIKALMCGSKVLILDEPTSMLTPQGIEELSNVMRQLVDQGLAIIFITHKLREALDMAGRITILRAGRVAGSLDPDFLAAHDRGTIQSKIIETMFGEDAAAVEDVAEIRGEVTGQRHRRELADEVALELRNLSVEAQRGEVGVRGLSLTVRAGEIMGLAGVDGNGQRELAEAIAGQRRLSGGEILIKGEEVGHKSVSQRQKHGLRYVTDDRIGEGIVSSLSVGLNLVLKRIGEDPYWRRGRICEEEISSTAADLVRGYDVRTPSVDAHCGTLSGGNIQKVLLARELSFEPEVVVYNKPTYGLDVKTTRAVRDRIREMAEESGAAALLISTDLEEILDLSDRIAVMFHGELSGVVENEPGVEKEVGILMVGGGEG